MHSYPSHNEENGKLNNKRQMNWLTKLQTYGMKYLQAELTALFTK